MDTVIPTLAALLVAALFAMRMLRRTRTHELPRRDATYASVGGDAGPAYAPCGDGMPAGSGWSGAGGECGGSGASGSWADDAAGTDVADDSGGDGGGGGD